jgi:hypothetical protein
VEEFLVEEARSMVRVTILTIHVFRSLKADLK